MSRQNLKSISWQWKRVKRGKPAVSGVYLAVSGRIRREVQGLAQVADRTMCIWHQATSSPDGYHVKEITPMKPKTEQTKPKLKKTTVYLLDTQDERLKLIAEQTGVPVATNIRNAIANFLDLKKQAELARMRAEVEALRRGELERRPG